jgi:hypothetical protein
MTHAPEETRKRMADELVAAPIVFSSADGCVTVHDISAMPWNHADEATLRSGEGAERLK